MADNSLKKTDKRKAISLADKIEIITKLQNGAANAQICRDYKLPKSTVSTIWANKKKYLNLQHVNAPTMKKLRGSSKPELDQSLLKWFSLKRSCNIPISGPILQSKASEFVNMAKSGTVNNNEPDTSSTEFVCSRGWIDRFKRRYNIHSGKMHGEAAAVSPNTVNQWLTTVWPNLKQKYRDCDIFNGDETGLFFKMTPDNTLTFKGEKCAGGKMSKERITVFVCANMDGSEKKKLIAIGKSASPRCFKNIPNLPVTYYSNRRAWITSELFEKIVRNWDEELVHQKRNILLLVDNCPAHPKIDNLKCIELVFLPPNVTAVLQPMDQGVIRCLKSHYRQQLLLKIITALDNNSETKISLLDAILMLATSWRRVSATTISNCFHHSGLSLRNEFDDDDEIPLSQWLQKEKNKDAEEGKNLNEWAKENGITEFENYNLNDFVSADDQLVIAEFPSDAEILSAAFSDNNKENELEDQEEQIIIPTPGQALDALRIVNTFVQFSSYDNRYVEAIEYLQKKIEREALEKRKKQSKITDFI